MIDKQKGNKHKGCEGELYAMWDACSKGYIVAKTIESDLFSYDFIMDDGEKLYRVEVKTRDSSRRSSSTGKMFNDRVVFKSQFKTNCGYTKKYGFVDWFVCYCSKWNKIAWIKRENMNGDVTIYKQDFEHLQLPINNKLNVLCLINEEGESKKQECLF